MFIEARAGDTEVKVRVSVSQGRQRLGNHPEVLLVVAGAHIEEIGNR
jgi:hypothetical protein